MAFEITAAWDFRGSDAPATKLVSKIGDITLAQNLDPVWSAEGVLCSLNAHRLQVQIPAGLRYAEPFWIMCSLRHVESRPSPFCAWFGYSHNDADANPFSGLFPATATAGGDAYLSTNGDGTLYESSVGGSIVPALDTDAVVTVKRLQGAAHAYLGSTLGATATVSNNTWPEYAATAQLFLGANPGTARDANTLYRWLLIGTGDITPTEIAAIQADVNSFIYPTDDTLDFTTPPSNSWDDEVIRPPIVVESSDTAFTGNVTLAKASGSGTLAGILTVAAVSGVATFSNVRMQGSGEHTLVASAADHTNETSAAFKVATGTGVPGGGSGVIIQGGGMQRALKDGETVATRKRLFFDIRKPDGSAWDGSVTGVKAMLSYTGAEPAPSSADIVRVGGASHFVELTNGEAAAGAPGDTIEAWVAPDTGRFESSHAFFEITADDLSAAALTATQLRDVIVPALVRASIGLDGYEYEKQPEESRVRVVIPGIGTLFISADFDPTSPPVTRLGGT